MRAFLGMALATAAFGAAGTYALLSGISLEAFASVLVAVGTFALAFYTWKSVSRTGQVIAGEDRRHQQSLAPLVLIYPSAVQEHPSGLGAVNGYRIHNIGYGLALNVQAEVVGALTQDHYERYEDTPENLARYDGYYDPANRSNIGDKTFINVGTRPTRRIFRELAVSAIAPSASLFYPDEDLAQAVSLHPAAVYELGRIRYQDMFGNDYATEYLDASLDTYKWVQPTHLRLPKAADLPD